MNVLLLFIPNISDENTVVKLCRKESDKRAYVSPRRMYVDILKLQSVIDKKNPMMNASKQTIEKGREKDK